MLIAFMTVLRGSGGGRRLLARPARAAELELFGVLGELFE